MKTCFRDVSILRLGVPSSGILLLRLGVPPSGILLLRLRFLLTPSEILITLFITIFFVIRLLRISQK